MSALQKRVLVHVTRIHVRLLACRERLIAATDPEALHDLRIAMRQLRSLLRPLRGLGLCAELSAVAAEVGRVSGPVRDLEVLEICLRKHGQNEAADARLARAQAGYAELLASAPLTLLFATLDGWPQAWREAEEDGQLRGLQQRIRKHMDKDRKRLYSALHEPGHDRHRLRLLVKRLRYALEAYPELAAGSAATHSLLKGAQSALGDWHDHWQWLLRAETEADLQPCVAGWQRAMQLAEREADERLQVLAADSTFSEWHP